MTDSNLYAFFEVMSGATPLSTAFVFVFGTLIGSFLNVCIYRLPVGRSIVLPPSACGACGVPLKWYHNIPILSYFLLQGACGYCYAPFSPRYALVEAVTGVLAALEWQHCGGPSYLFLYDLVLTGLVIVVFFIDLDYWIILDETSLGGMVAGMVGSVWLSDVPSLGLGYVTSVDVTHLPHWLGHLLASMVGAAVGYAFFACIATVGALLAHQEAMGGGDVKFAALIGAFLGWQNAMLSFVLAFWIGGMVAIPLFLLRGGRKRDPIPFGTFMAIGVILVLLYAQPMMRWLMRLAPMGDF